MNRVKYYGSSQPDLGKEPAPPESLLYIENPMDKPKIAPRIPKGFLMMISLLPSSNLKPWDYNLAFLTMCLS